MLTALLFCEALEDNEVLIVEGVLQVARLSDPRHKAVLELLDSPITVRHS